MCKLSLNVSKPPLKNWSWSALVPCRVFQSPAGCCRPSPPQTRPPGPPALESRPAAPPPPDTRTDASCRTLRGPEHNDHGPPRTMLYSLAVLPSFTDNFVVLRVGERSGRSGTTTTTTGPTLTRSGVFRHNRVADDFRPIAPPFVSSIRPELACRPDASMITPCWVIKESLLRGIRTSGTVSLVMLIYYCLLLVIIEFLEEIVVVLTITLKTWILL